jgi:hypothetical protein
VSGEDSLQRAIRVGQQISVGLAEYAAPVQLVLATSATDELNQLPAS